MAYDVARQRLVLHGGTAVQPEKPIFDTWEWDGWEWKLCKASGVPTWTGACSMVYDAARARITLVSPGDPTTGMAVWTWDGVDWTNRTPVVGPKLRSAYSLSYDSQRQRIVLFGGSEVFQVLGDTWEWDGAAWIQRTPLTSPPPRSGHTMAFSPTRGRTLLTGGAGWSGTFNDTWEWDGNGNTWVQLNPPTPAPLRVGARMEYLPSADRIVLFGGRPSYPASDSAETWIWNGVTWTLAAPPLRPPARSQHAMAYDARMGLLVIFGGQRFLGNEIYGFGGTTWKGIESPATPPPADKGVAAFDELRGRTVLHVPATGITYELEGPHSRAFPPDGATPAEALAMVYDRVRRRLLIAARGPLAMLETWERRGTAWARIPTATSPLLGTGTLPVLAFDHGRDRAVLFSGQGAGAQTWEFDGKNWRRITTTIAPPEAVHAMTYDPARKVTFALAGYERFNRRRATVWTFDGSDWRQSFPDAAPPAREFAGATFDPVRERVVIFGGTAVDSITSPPIDFRDLQEWDGTAWTTSPGSGGAPARIAPLLLYDTVRSRLVVLGSRSFGSLTNPWEYGPVNPAGLGSFGAGCAGSLGVPYLRSREDALPWLGAPFTFELDRVSAAVSTTPPVLLLGDSRSMWSGSPLPLDLGRYGMPGCTLLSAVTLSSPMTLHPGFARQVLLVPNTPSLVGKKLYAQGLATDPGANPAGFVTSNACELTLGAK